MKQLVCDFCDSVRLGLKVGIKEYRKAFEQARQVRQFAKSDNFLSHDVYKVSDRTMKMDAKVQDVRELAQRNYKPENDVVKD